MNNNVTTPTTAITSDSALHMKRCTKCGQEKPISQFYRRARSSDGYSARCKECTSEDQKAHYQASKTPVVSGGLEKFAGITDRVLQEQIKELFTELRARGWQVECKLSYLQTKHL